MRLLILGAGGMLGRDLVSAAAGEGHDVSALAHADLDITDAERVLEVVRSAEADAIFNCAAWTDVDGAESQPEQAAAVNGQGAAAVARAAALTRTQLIHISTDYVFDGLKGTPYVESDATGPRSQYGASKLAGEIAVAAEAPGLHTVVRTSWLFGTGGHCFPKTILRLAAERDELTVVADQVGSPTYTGHLAPALLTLADTRPQGIIHVCAAGQCSWYEFAQAIVERAGLGTRVGPGRTEDLARPAPRPANSVLGTERPADVPTLPAWEAGLESFMQAEVPA